jgi:hypothetical protein
MKRSVIILALLLLTAFTVSGQSVRVPPTTPTLTSPMGSMDTHAPQFTWTGENAISYKLAVFNAANTRIFNHKYMAADVCFDSSCAVSPSFDGLTLYNGAYSWRVIAKNDDGTAKSTKAAFTIQYPGKANLTSPVEGMEVSTMPTFQWEEVVQADQYRVNLVRTNNGAVTDWLSASSICSASCSYTFPNELKKGAYKWRVLTRNSGVPGYRSKSKAGAFKVVIPQ